MVSLILIALAAFFNSVMDALENENFFESIFRNMNQRFWYKRESWKSAKKIFNYKLDAWHISKSLMVFTFILGIGLQIVSKHVWHTGKIYIDIGLNILISGVVWNASFILFYNKIFKVK